MGGRGTQCYMCDSCLGGDAGSWVACPTPTNGPRGDLERTSGGGGFLHCSYWCTLRGSRCPSSPPVTTTSSHSQRRPRHQGVWCHPDLFNSFPARRGVVVMGGGREGSSWTCAWVPSAKPLSHLSGMEWDKEDQRV